MKHAGVPVGQAVGHAGQRAQEAAPLGKSARAGADPPSPTEQQTSVRRRLTTPSARALGTRWPPAQGHGRSGALMCLVHLHRPCSAPARLL